MLIFCTLNVFSQNEEFKVEEDSINQYFNLIMKSRNDAEIKQYNMQIVSQFNKIFRHETSFYYPFSALEHIGKVTSPDKRCRVFTWDIRLTDGTHSQSGFIQYFSKKQKKVLTYELIDKSAVISSPENIELEHTNWFGAIYYEILMRKANGIRYYTLLGWNGNNDLTNKKVIEVLYFDENEKPVFGAPIFKIKGKQPRRIVFEYAKRTSMTLRYEKKLKMIVYDHLSPSKPEFENVFQYYGPDFSNDGFKFRKGMWVNFISIDVRLKKK